MTTAVPTSTAETAAEYLWPLAQVELSKYTDVPMLLLPSDDPRTRAVIESWFNNSDNIARIEEKVGKVSEEALRSRLYTAFPIVYGRLTRVGAIKPPFPGKVVVLIALEELNENNGLPVWKECPQKLLQGEHACFLGDEAQLFRGNSGGIALLLVFNLDA